MVTKSSGYKIVPHTRFATDNTPMLVIASLHFQYIVNSRALCCVNTLTTVAPDIILPLQIRLRIYEFKIFIPVNLRTFQISSGLRDQDLLGTSFSKIVVLITDFLIFIIRLLFIKLFFRKRFFALFYNEIH